ncbi:MAG: hypothetical protein C0413_01835 [Clostridiales bacterium]|nr:hypothetical protein [Clostridiales bacterium]
MGTGVGVAIGAGSGVGFNIMGIPLQEMRKSPASRQSSTAIDLVRNCMFNPRSIFLHCNIIKQRRQVN